MGFVNSSIVSQQTNVTKTIYNETIALANTEQSLAIPGKILGYLIKVRGNTAELKLSHVATESGTKFLTIPKNAVHTDDYPYTGLTLYFQSPSAGAIVEVVTWS
jgi:hypothetical protein